MVFFTELPWRSVEDDSTAVKSRGVACLAAPAVDLLLTAALVVRHTDGRSGFRLHLR